MAGSAAATARCQALASRCYTCNHMKVMISQMCRLMPRSRCHTCNHMEVMIGNVRSLVASPSVHAASIWHCLTCRRLLHLCEQEQWHKEPQITRRMWRADFRALRPGLRKHLAQLQNIGTGTSTSSTDSVPQLCKKAVKHEEPAAASSCSHMFITQMCVSRSAHQELNVSGSYLYSWLEQA